MKAPPSTFWRFWQAFLSESSSTLLSRTWCFTIVGEAPNNSFKPNLLRYANNMAGKACHVVGSATQVGLTQVLGRTSNLSRFTGGVMYFTIGFFVGLVMLGVHWGLPERSEEHTSELKSLMRHSYAVF